MTRGPWQPDPAWPALDEPITPTEPRRWPHARTTTVLALLGAVVAVLGLPLGLVWAAFAPDVPVLVTGQGPLLAEPQPEQPAAADGWFTLLALPFGALVAGGAWLVAPGRRGPGAVVAVAAGAAAAGLVAWWVGRQVGLAAYEAALASAPEGTVLSRPADLRAVAAGWWPPVAAGVPLTPGLFAALAYTLLAAWSRFPALVPHPTPAPPPALVPPPALAPEPSRPPDATAP